MAALHFMTAAAATQRFGPSDFFSKRKTASNCSSSLGFGSKVAAAASSSEGRPVAEEGDEFSVSDDASSFASARAQLDRLEQLTSTGPSAFGYERDSDPRNETIRDQLARLVGDRDDDFSIPLGKNLKKISPKFLSTSQKRNIRRQAYLTEVSQRNDSVFFATIGAFVILPPLVILGIALLVGYVQLFP